MQILKSCLGRKHDGSYLAFWISALCLCIYDQYRSLACKQDWFLLVSELVKKHPTADWRSSSARAGDPDEDCHPLAARPRGGRRGRRTTTRASLCFGVMGRHPRRSDGPTGTRVSAPSQTGRGSGRGRELSRRKAVAGNGSFKTMVDSLQTLSNFCAGTFVKPADVETNKMLRELCLDRLKRTSCV